MITPQSPYNKMLAEFTRQDREEYMAALKAVLHTKEGRVLYRKIISATHIYDYLNASKDSATLEYQAGIHNLGITFLSACNEVAPEMLLLAQKERNEQMQERNIKLKAVSKQEEKY